MEEEKVEGEIYYKKDCPKSCLLQAIYLMQEAAKIKGNSFGMMERNGQAKFSSWKDFLYSIVGRIPESEQNLFRQGIEDLPELKGASFIFTDCNMANFVFDGEHLVKGIDIERPLWGDPLFLYGVIKSRNSYMYALLGKEAHLDIIDFYAKIYPFIYESH